MPLDTHGLSHPWSSTARSGSTSVSTHLAPPHFPASAQLSALSPLFAPPPMKYAGFCLKSQCSFLHLPSPMVVHLSAMRKSRSFLPVQLSLGVSPSWPSCSINTSSQRPLFPSGLHPSGRARRPVQVPTLSLTKADDAGKGPVVSGPTERHCSLPFHHRSAQ